MVPYTLPSLHGCSKRRGIKASFRYCRRINFSRKSGFFTMSVVAATRQSSSRIGYALAGLVGAGASLFAYQQLNQKKPTPNALWGASAIVNKAEVPAGLGFEDYQKVYNDIAAKVHEQEDADGGIGRYGLLCRLGWHTSGTYDKKDNSGGSYSGSMIYSPESIDGANAGLEIGRDFLYEFREKYPWISRGDLWTLGGVVSIQESGGPKIPWRPGRKDIPKEKRVPEAGRLPDASRDGAYVRNLFARMGMNDRETVALIGAHVLGQCHEHNSGYKGPWGPSYNMFTNDFYVRLLGKWHVKKWDGNKQYEDDETNSFMMLPTDIALKENNYFLKYVKMYAEDQDLFFKDFSQAYAKLLELGVTFPKDQKPWEFQTLDDQDDE